jgi:hypothetical protein
MRSHPLVLQPTACKRLVIRDCTRGTVDAQHHDSIANLDGPIPAAVFGNKRSAVILPGESTGGVTPVVEAHAKGGGVRTEGLDRLKVETGICREGSDTNGRSSPRNSSKTTPKKMGLMPLLSSAAAHS